MWTGLEDIGPDRDGGKSRARHKIPKGVFEAFGKNEPVHICKKTGGGLRVRVVEGGCTPLSACTHVTESEAANLYLKTICHE